MNDLLTGNISIISKQIAKHLITLCLAQNYPPYARKRYTILKISYIIHTLYPIVE